MRLCLVLCLTACGVPQPPAGPLRVVSLLPSFTEIVLELGAGDVLAGCTEFCRPGREIPRVPWRDASAAEPILRLRPTLVLRQAPRRANDALTEVLSERGVTVLSLPSETIADVRRAMIAIGQALGRSREATTLVERFNAELVRARAGALGRPAPKVLFVIGRDGGGAANLRAAGPGTFIDELIRFAGGRNVLAGRREPYPNLRLEDLVVELKPDVIIDNLPPEDDPLTAWSGIAHVPAIKNRRVYAVRDALLLVPGPRLPQAVKRLVEMVHGEP